MENQIFKIETETGEIKDAELITVVTIDGKEYAIYMIDDDMGMVEILASYVQKDAEGFDTLVDIDDEEDRQKVLAFINDLVSTDTVSEPAGEAEDEPEFEVENESDFDEGKPEFEDEDESDFDEDKPVFAYDYDPIEITVRGREQGESIEHYEEYRRKVYKHIGISNPSDGIKARNVKVISEMPGSMKISTPKGVFILNFGKDSL